MGYLVVMNAPLINEWGPSLWKILHSLAERSHKTIAIRGSDEVQRCWINVINGLTKGIPCPMCRNHFKDYISKNRFDACLSVTGELRRSRIREYFWKLHNFVRSQKSQPIEVDSINHLIDLYDIYPYDKYRHDYNIVHEHMKRAVRVQWLNHDDINRCLRAIEELWRVLC